MKNKHLLQKATLAAGCFWHVEEAFKHVKGVISTTVGYTGGKLESPTYEDVCTDKTEHAEAIEIEYDPSTVSYKEILEVFWNCHDPTQINKQGPDIGTQYRSAIFYHNEEQKKEAIASKLQLQKTDKYRNKNIVTEITKASRFYKAEEYHQGYLEKRGRTTC